MEKYDVIVIGSGSGGLTVSIGLAGAGKKVALIEKGLLGGDCTNFGCVPSKALIDIAKNGKWADVSDALQQVRERRKIIQDEETVEKIEKYGMKIYKGFASFKDKNTLLLDGKDEIHGDKIVISTGSHPLTYPIDGLTNKEIYTNENIFEIAENFERLAIIGGGYIGCELAESFANLGVKVTIIQRNIRLIPREEKESSEIIEKVFKEKGIEVLTNTTVEKAHENKLIVLDKGSEVKKEVPYDKVLVALGRGANVDGLHLEDTGIKYDSKGIFVNKYNQTNIKNIFAIGDCVNGNPQFTHWANNEGRGVVRNILFGFIKDTTRKAILPATLYTNIEVSRVGKTQDELLKKYTTEDIVSFTIHFDHNDRSIITKDTVGFVKIIFRRISGEILGATIVGKGAGEMLPVLTAAMTNNISAYKLSKQIFSYPTKTEIIKKVADKFVISTLSNIKLEAKYFFKDNILQIATFIIWGIILYSFFNYKISNDLSFEQMAIGIYNYISQNPVYGPFIYMALYTIRPIVLFPATLMTFMSGALFGLWGGLAFTLVGENLSAMFAYFLGGVLGKKLVGRGDDTGIVNELKNKANESPFTTILMTRLLFFPFDIVNYVSGFLKIRFRSFVGATIIGIIPGATVFILAGSSFYNDGKTLTSFTEAIKDIDVSMLWYAGILFVVTLLFAKFLKKKQKK